MKVLKIYSETCGPCKVLEKNLQAAGISHENVDVDSEQGEELVSKYKVRGIPTLLLVNDEDHVINRYTGVMNVEELKDFVNETN